VNCVNKNDYDPESGQFAGILTGIGNWFSNSQLGQFTFSLGQNAANSAVSGLINKQFEPDINVRYTPITQTQSVNPDASQTNSPASIDGSTGVLSQQSTSSGVVIPSRADEFMQWLPFVMLGLGVYRTFFK